MGTTTDKLNYLKDTKEAIKAAIVEKGVAVPDDTTFRAYADKVKEISGGGGVEPPPEALVLSGDCSKWYSFALNKWAFDNYKNKMSTKDITRASYMFQNFQEANIPFDINLKMGYQMQADFLFSNALNLIEIPKIPKIHLWFDKNAKYYSLSFVSLFDRCYNLQDVPETLITDINPDILQIKIDGFFDFRMFNDCYSLKKLPKMTMLYETDKQVNIGLYGDYSLKSVDLPVLKKPVSKQIRIYIVPRMRQITFDKSREYYKDELLDQTGMTYDLTNNVGYYQNAPTSYRPKEKEIWNDSTYAALKNDPDAWASKPEYSFYNHDSAVETINSLPNISGANTIKFEGKSGLKTDGGAIKTLTPDEIAVATNKGFTVSLT